MADPRAKRLLDREFNLSHGATLPEHNQVSAGRWAGDEVGRRERRRRPCRVAQAQDRPTSLTFDVGGATAQGRITSLRKVDWSSMRVNFFVIFPRATMPDVPATYIAAFRAPDVAGFDNALSRNFPNITNIDVSASIAQIQRVLDQVIRAVEFLFGFTLACRPGGVVRRRVGNSRSASARIRSDACARREQASCSHRCNAPNCSGWGALAGVLASLAAIAVGWALARLRVRVQAGTPRPGCRSRAGITGALLALAAGWWGLREVLRRPVIETLRRAAQE